MNSQQWYLWLRLEISSGSSFYEVKMDTFTLSAFIVMEYYKTHIKFWDTDPAHTKEFS